MIKLLLKKFVPDSENVSDKKVREGYGILSGAIGIVCNLVLFAVKLAIGLVMSSIAIMSDAFNNLSDMGSSVISIISAKMSGRRPDAKHPFGHGRIEYISSLIISFLIMLVGIELFKSSFNKIFSPEPVVLNPVLIVILMLSVSIKLWMWSYNRYMSKKIDSALLSATATDSLNDCISTTAVIVSTVVGGYFKINIDGYIGCAVSLLILYVGFSLSRETVSILLGKAPDKETVEALSAILTESPNVLGIHDLIVHDYGPGRVFASVHAEVSDSENITMLHEEIDALENHVMNTLGIELVIHMDPISTNSEVLTAARKKTIEIISSLGDYTIHDFRMTDGENRINLIFDIVVPCSMKENERAALGAEIARRLKEEDGRFAAVIKIDNDYSPNK